MENKLIDYDNQTHPDQLLRRIRQNIEGGKLKRGIMTWRNTNPLSPGAFPDY